MTAPRSAAVYPPISPNVPCTMAPGDIPATVRYLEGGRVIVSHSSGDSYHQNAIATRNRLRAKGLIIVEDEA